MNDTWSVTFFLLLSIQYALHVRQNVIYKPKLVKDVFDSVDIMKQSDR